MPLLIPLLEWLVPLVALALCALAYALAAPIANFLHTGWGLLDRGIAWLTNKAIDLGIEFTKWLAPYFLQAVDHQVGMLHQLGQLAHYSAHFAWRSATTFANFNHWLLKSYLPGLFHYQSDTTVTKTITKVRTIPLSKAQILNLEHAIEWDLRKTTAGTIPVAVPKAWPKLNWTPRQWREYLGLAAGAGALALPGSIAWDRAKWKEQNKTNAKTTHRFRTLNWLLAFTGAAGLVAAGLAKLGLGWMSKCNNLKHIGPAFCGANLSGLIGLFGALAIVEGNFSIVTLAEEMLAIEQGMVKVIGGAFSELDGLV